MTPAVMILDLPPELQIAFCSAAVWVLQYFTNSPFGRGVRAVDADAARKALNAPPKMELQLSGD